MKHGERSTYVYYGCKCAECLEAENAYQREYKRRRGYKHQKAQQIARQRVVSRYKNLYRRYYQEALAEIEKES